MIIPKLVERKIRYLCNIIYDKEWSGTLFYKVNGSFEDGSLIVTCTDIFIMDIGSSAYTEFDMSPDVMNYMAENPELLNCQIGLIHSHDLLPSFFSGTDLNTLREEGIDRNHFVSLIVNNVGDYTAAITRRVKIKKVINESFCYESFEGIPVKGENSWEEESEELQYFHLIITKEMEDYQFSTIDNRLAEIKKAKENKTKENFYTPMSESLPKSQKYTEKQTKLNFDLEDSDNFEYSDRVEQIKKEDIKANPEFIHYLCLQLLTGSAMIPVDSNIDINKWVNNMKSIVEKRFGVGEEGINKYKDFIEYFVEYLVWNSDDPTLINIVEGDYMMSIIASDMWEYINKLPKNIYIKICQDELSNHIM